jgi:hypothetical protein
MSKLTSVTLVEARSPGELVSRPRRQRRWKVSLMASRGVGRMAEDIVLRLVKCLTSLSGVWIVCRELNARYSYLEVRRSSAVAGVGKEIRGSIRSLEQSANIEILNMFG